MAPDSSSTPPARLPGFGTVLLGLLLGLGYGVALRAWMRLISTDPEFSWSGTGFIVGVFTVLGTMAGLATVARARWGTRTVLAVRLLGIVLSLGCFMAAGAAMIPTVVPAGLGVSRTDWPRWLRGLLIAVGAAAAVGVIATLPGLEPGRRAWGLLIYLALVPIEVALVARLYAPNLASIPRRTVAIAAPVMVVGLLGMLVLTTGIR